MDLDSVSSFEIVNHIGSSFFITMVEDVVLWVHLPLDLMDFVGSVRAILCHDDGTFEFSIDEILIVP